MVSGVFSIALGDPASQAADTSATRRPRRFVAGPENALAQVAAEDWLSATTSTGPLVFCGPHGVGKTLLAEGLLRRWKSAHDSQTAISTTGADFARAYANAVKCDGIVDFRERYRNVGALVVDDLDAMAGKPSAQEELTATIDGLLSRGGWVLITTRQLPAANDGLAPRLTSRLTGGLVVPLAIPQAETRRALLLAMAEQAGVELRPEAATLLGDRLAVAAPNLQSALMELIANSETSGDENPHSIDVAAATEFLQRNNPTSAVNISTIAKAVAREFQLKLTDLRSTSRQQTLVRARGIAMLLARRHTSLSLKQIGKHFNRRDHTTVMHACNKAEEAESSDPEVRQLIAKLEGQLLEAQP